ncbi:P-loop containing nucleoside triphosphate hydrolase protein [Mycena belliarum]|uniref:Translation initiation factor IF-2, mitochondrial n=1 Tax=Mycena belliarum TaxID=1033014 RepID=A0AAD6U5Q9_9AGAR|nr:P-loop containing nucleoside triphosphate hydrolase protein [Mycena belliae]
MFQAGMGEQASFDYVLTSDYAVLLAEEFGRKPIVNDEAAFDLYPPPPHPDPASLPSRPPVVTIMGHVDHGKTTLLDTLRSASVAQGEVGGITQHIGAFSVPVPSGTGAGGPQSITFLDTPGHAAFSAMRARGAQVTDIIVLVVAADDGIMPQTREVIELIKKDREKIGVVVAINKIDKPGCDVDALHKALLVEDIHVEELGGDTPAVEVSGLTGKGLPDLVETLSLIAEIQDLRAERDGMVFGYVLESKVVKGLGPIATVLILRGSLFPGSHVVSGVHHAKVRIMQDSNGKSVKSASPGMAVTVSGWKSLPSAGDEVLQGTESEIKKAIANRQRKADIEVSLRDIEAINSSRQQERERRQAEEEAETAGDAAQLTPKEEVLTGPKELRLLIKADVSGSAEAVEGALQGIGNHLAVTKIISSGVGDIMESDVMMAKAVGGTIVGFSVLSNRTVDSLAGQHNVPIITSDIIYRLMEDVKARVIKMLPVIIESRVIGEAKVLQIFDIQVKGKQTKKVAGSRVINGLIEKNKLARVMRGGDIVHEGSFDTMRHFKKDVTEIRKGNECGLNLADFDDLQVDDIIQTYETVEKPGVL